MSERTRRSARTGSARESAATPGDGVTFTFNGASCQAASGESLAAALLSSGVRSLRRSQRTGEPRGVYCGIGLCFDCIVTVDGRPNVRACMTLAAGGMQVESSAAKISLGA